MSINAWMGQGGSVQTNRAEDAWNRILDKPSSIVIVRKGVADLAPQTIRVEFDRSQGSEAAGDAAQSSRRWVTVFGVRGHPTVANTNIRRGDRFVWNEIQFTVRNVILTNGEVQASAEAYT